MSTDRRVDEKGRVTIPQDIRERLGLDPGEEVTVVASGGEIVIRPKVSRAAAVEALRGCVNAATRASDADRPTPEDLKDDWTSDLPGR